MRTVSANVSPFDDDELLASALVTTRPPNRSIAASKLSRVRVDGSRNSVAKSAPTPSQMAADVRREDVGAIEQCGDVAVAEIGDRDEVARHAGVVVPQNRSSVRRTRIRSPAAAAARAACSASVCRGVNGAAAVNPAPKAEAATIASAASESPRPAVTDVRR